MQRFGADGQCNCGERESEREREIVLFYLSSKSNSQRPRSRHKPVLLCRALARSLDVDMATCDVRCARIHHAAVMSRQCADDVGRVRWQAARAYGRSRTGNPQTFYFGDAPCGLRGCKNGPAPFPGRMSYKATKPGLVSVLYLSMFLLCCCLLWPLFMYCWFSLYVFCLLIVLVKLSLLAK